ncbi:ribokinase [Loigolactobacillus coryniformis]|uniref:Ribokinase n=1 Tax=Loigolactobacillus coryniformis subsp. coryniformis CECT 5711 TaxID=1185325 RepID=J2Z868_9LACO|nr:ribokinase [Loigolactobacillus coryniformis]EJN56783.1 Sugar kinase, ribokinase family [Loigolactobacillus coryniformis subsp. coryniformis CECT 5711]MDC4184793.1 ribokinase [Loigolactobacillus coryniformis]
MTRVTILGSINVDTILQIPRLPKPGETLAMSGKQVAGGGKGANQAIAAARAEADTAFIGKVGDDANGKMMLKALQNAKIDTTQISTSNYADTGEAFILLDDNGQNSILVDGGTNQEIKIGDIETAHETIENADFLITQFETPLTTTLAAFRYAKSVGVTTILNPAPAKTDLDPELLKLTDLIVPNETESETLTGIKVTDEASMNAAATALIKQGVKAVIITVGAKGAYYQTKADHGFVKAFKVDAVDTTAAGDTFIGALSSRLNSDLSNLPAAVLFANKASSLTVQKLGAQPSIPHLSEILADGEIKKA